MITIHLLINSYSARVEHVFFLNHKTSVATKVQTRKNLLLIHDSTLKHSAHVFLPLNYSVKEQPTKRDFAYETNGECLHLLKCCFSGGKIALCALNTLMKQMHNTSIHTITTRFELLIYLLKVFLVNTVK